MTEPPRARAPAAAPRLVGNGVDATTGAYLLPAMDMHQLARVATGHRVEGDELTELQDRSRQARQANFMVVEGVDPNDLSQAGWAAVFPAITGDAAAAARQAAIRDALGPLLAHRRAQATAGEDRYREYAGELGYRAGETKQQYLVRLGIGPGPAQPHKVPYYLLLVATPEEIPYRIQYQLDVHYAVGRIAFDTVDEYARYARSVVDAETGRVTRARRAAFFGVANPDDAATRLSADHLVMPLVAHAEGRRAQHGFSVDSYLASAATRDRLIELLRDPPALLFTAGHGMGFPSGHAAQRERQGALLCQDWAGPGHPVAREHYLAGDDLPAGADLRGTIAMFFACYGGGTPARDEFTPRALGEAQARILAPAPMIARLPQRMLGHAAGGALAVVGHIDRAWGSTFLWIDAQGKAEPRSHLDVFESMLDGVLAGKRLGYAMEAFNLRYAELAADLSERLEQIQLYGEPYEDSELAHMWIYNSDARNYAVIGDPAVRIPDTRPGAHDPTRPPPITVRGPAPTSGGAAGPARPGDDMTDPTQRSTTRDVTRDVTLASPAAPAAPPPATGEAGEAAPGGAAPAAMRSFGWFGNKADAAAEPAPGVLARLGGKLGDMLSDMLNDAAVLEVKTYTSHDLTAVAHGAPLHTTAARLRAYTRCDLDGDTDACLPVTETGAVDQALWALHLEMVKQAQAHRTELLKTVLSLFAPRVGS